MNRSPVQTILILIAFLAAASVTTAQQRALTTDDLFRLEELSDQFTFSPDGQWLAYVLKRPRQGSAPHKYPFLEGHDRSDVWLLSTAGAVGDGNPINLTKGEKQGAGYWRPSWSPDGERLAMLSTKGDNVHLWVWEKSSSRLVKVTERTVDYSVQQNPYRWLSNRQLVCAVLPQGHKPNAMTIMIRGPETLMRVWPKAWAGQETTVSVLESGVPLPFDTRPQGALLLIDLAKDRTSKAVAGYAFREPQPSPNKQYVAALKQIGVTVPDATRPLIQQPQQLYQAIVINKDGSLVLPALSRIHEVQTNSVRWSPDSSSLALIGRKAKGAKLQVFSCVVLGDRCVAVTTEDMTPSALAWSGKNELLVRSTAAGSSRADWWTVNESTKRNVTATLKSSPVAFFRESAESFIGLADGDVWRVSIAGDAPQNLTGSFEPRVASIVWPRVNETDERASYFVFGVRNGTHLDLHRLDPASTQITPVTKPHAEAAFVGVAPQQSTLVFRLNDRSGTYLWTGRLGTDRFTRVVETNKFLRDIAQGEVRRIEYRGLDGQDLRAWLILPANYQDGKRYPMVTWVYAGTIVGERPSPMTQLNTPHSLNLQLLAARGYAVLIPSMPLKAEGETTDPYLELTKGVLPAVDKAIDLGIADPKKLGVIGHSYGGYATYGLITQTHRFQAAVALAGIADLASLYGQFDVRFRYDEFANERLFFQAWAEGGQGRMGSAPWQDLGRYLRNSPIAYAERVQTPLLIIQGDLDFVGMQQGEQFFTALYRQNKRARFARYWGEEHVFESPANIKDMWQQIFKWLDEHLQHSDGLNSSQKRSREK